ncbi:MAG: M14 family metallocarboxypeptidase [Treponema sp.]|nr:M14 family metallocarboxypeptidase [Treponema sp.]
MKKKHPILKIFDAKKSLCGRSIHQIEIGNIYQSPALMVGAFHGMEWLTTLVLLKFIENLCIAIKDRKRLCGIKIYEFLEKRGLVIIPCLNPDGVEISINGAQAAYRYRELVSKVSLNDTSKWQANARGVDLNHNFNADWKRVHMLEQSQGIIGPAPTRYGGPYPESEPETQFLVNLCLFRKFRHVIAFHRQGEEIYWDFGNNTPSKSKYLAKIMSLSSGYKVSKPEGIAVGGGFKDWFIQKFHKPGFTVEIGKGQNPLPLSDLMPVYNRLEEMLVLMSIL